MPEKVCEFEFYISLYFPTPPRLGVIIWGTDKICQRSAPVWLMSVLQIRSTIPYNARKAVAEARKIQAGKEVTKREDMEKAFQPVLSNLNLVVVVLSFGKKHCLLHGGALCGPPIPPVSDVGPDEGRENGGPE